MTYDQLKASLPLMVVNLILGIIKVEGGYVNNPNDKGGATKYGITEAVARAHGYTGAMQDLPEQTAFEIYLHDYYQAPGFDKIGAVSALLASELTDTGVNMGQSRAVGFLQSTLNALNAGFAPDLPTVSTVSDAYLTVLGRELAAEKQEVLYDLLNGLQGKTYLGFALAKQSQREFLLGWVSNRVDLKPVALKAPVAGSTTFDQLDPAINRELADIGDLIGKPSIGYAMFQRVLNGFNFNVNTKGTLFADLLDDGSIGGMTINAYNAVCSQRGAARVVPQIVKLLNCLQADWLVQRALLQPSYRASLANDVAQRIG